MIALDGALLLLSLHATFSNAATADLSSISVHYDVEANLYDMYAANLTLTNTGAETIDSGDDFVSIYTCFIRLVIGSQLENGHKVNTSGPSVTVYHLDGCSHKIVYDAPFRLAPGESRSIILEQKHWNVAITDNMLNWYIQLGDGAHNVISNTANSQLDFVGPYDTPAKYLRLQNGDLVKPFTLKERYDKQNPGVAVNDDMAKKRLVPDIFQSLDSTEFTNTISDVNSVSVTYSEDVQVEDIKFVIGRDGSVGVATPTLPIPESRVKVILQMLLERFNNMLPVGTFSTKVPRFGFRGFMIDLARHFIDKDSIKRQLDVMARYQFNYLHLHLTDDESWSIEIDEIPELTQYGSKQCFNLSQCATYPQLGRHVIRDNDKTFLSRSDYIEVVQYAANLGITVLPEIELPGHATAAINSMKIRYDIDSNSIDYRLHDPNDKSNYSSVQYFTSGAMNPCVNSTFDFIAKVMQVLKQYHTEAGSPLKLIHLAGDEVAEHAWMESPMCNEMVSGALQENATGTDKRALIKETLLRRIGQIAEQESLDIGFWEDGLIDKTTGVPYNRDTFPLSINVYGFVWQTVWEWWGGDRAFNLANQDYKVVMAPATRFYMDHSQEPHPHERGYYWATRYTDMKRCYSFRPINYYANIDGPKVMGALLTMDEWCTPWKCPPLEQSKLGNIVGVEAPLFGETISTDDHIDNNVWPRLLAVAERAWNEAPWEHLNGSNPAGLDEDFALFMRSVELFEIPALEEKGIKYHLSPPGIIVQDRDESIGALSLRLSTEFDNQKVWWKPSSSDKYVEVPNSLILTNYTKGDRISLATSNAAGDRMSYEVEFYEWPTTTMVPTTHNGSSDLDTSRFLLLTALIFITNLFINLC